MRKKPIRPVPKYELDNYRATTSLGEIKSPDELVTYMKSRGWYQGGAADIDQLVNTLKDVRVKYEDTSPHDAYIKQEGDATYTIGINKNHAPNRQRWSLAHELAHYFLHKTQIENSPIEEKILHRNDSTTAIERQANDFAAKLLMPENDFFSVLNSKQGAVADMAIYFKVSELAVRYRAKTLGIRGHGV